MSLIKHIGARVSNEFWRPLSQELAAPCWANWVKPPHFVDLWDWGGFLLTARSLVDTLSSKRQTTLDSHPRRFANERREYRR
jgi:hypothetical protein